MKVALVTLSASKRPNGAYTYFTEIIESQESKRFTRLFLSAYEMLDVVNGILATQTKKRYTPVNPDLETICGTGLYFFDLDLTVPQAERLGWKPKREIKK